MKKKVLSVLLTSAMVMSMAACGETTTEAPATPDAGTTDTTVQSEPAVDTTEPAEVSELTDGKFAETRHITVEIYDRGNDGGSDPTNNMYTEYIKKGMLEDHNVEVEFVAVPRWTEVEEINNLLAAGTAPDICVTYSYPTSQSLHIFGTGSVRQTFTGIRISMTEHFGQSKVSVLTREESLHSFVRTGSMHLI